MTSGAGATESKQERLCLGIDFHGGHGAKPQSLGRRVAAGRDFNPGRTAGIKKSDKHGEKSPISMESNGSIATGKNHEKPKFLGKTPVFSRLAFGKISEARALRSDNFFQFNGFRGCVGGAVSASAWRSDRARIRGLPVLNQAQSRRTYYCARPRPGRVIASSLVATSFGFARLPKQSFKTNHLPPDFFAMFSLLR